MDSDDSGSTEPEIRHGSSSMANDSLTCENAQFEDGETKTSVSNDDYGSTSVTSQHLDANNQALHQGDVSNEPLQINAPKETSTASPMMVPHYLSNLSISEAARMNRLVKAKLEEQRLVIMQLQLEQLSCSSLLPACSDAGHSRRISLAAV